MVADGLKPCSRASRLLLEEMSGQTPAAPRKMDLDILVWNGEIVDPDVYEREFLRRSVIELCPELEKTLKEERGPA